MSAFPKLLAARPRTPDMGDWTGYEVTVYLLTGRMPA
jgi:hypothetical protein